MKAVPCRNPKCSGHPEMAGTATLKDGSPYLVGRIHSFPYTYKCMACKMNTTLSLMDWNRLPNVQQEQIDAVSLGDPLSHKDFRAMTKGVRES